MTTTPAPLGSGTSRLRHDTGGIQPRSVVEDDAQPACAPLTLELLPGAQLHS